ncbi:MAG TPA: hypothetical protein VIL85_25675 [Thermomicrobiales bacterium]|jgi:hypothetical protein
MRWYAELRAAVQRVLPTLRATQAAGLALLVSALLARRALNLSDSARAYATPAVRRVARPKHDLLHRLKRLWRFLDNTRLDALALQVAFLPHTLAALGRTRRLGLAVDCPLFDTRLPDGTRRRYQGLRVAVPRCGRALPVLQVAYDRDALPAALGQNQLEAAALLAVLHALPSGVTPVVLADRGCAHAPFLAWLQRHGATFVVRVAKGTCLTEADGTRWKLGQRDPARWHPNWHAAVRYGLHHDRPRDVTISLTRAGGCPATRPATRAATRPPTRGTSPPTSPAPPRSAARNASAASSPR